MPWLGMFAAVLAGGAAGCVTGLLQTKLGIHPILSGILTMSGLYSVNLFIMGASSNLSLIGQNTVFTFAINGLGMEKELAKTLLALLFCIICVVLLSFFFKTHLGLCIRATGNNEDMVRASSLCGLHQDHRARAIGNACCRAFRRVVAQYQALRDISSGVGMWSSPGFEVIIGEVILGQALRSPWAGDPQ